MAAASDLLGRPARSLFRGEDARRVKDAVCGASERRVCRLLGVAQSIRGDEWRPPRDGSTNGYNEANQLGSHGSDELRLPSYKGVARQVRT